MFLLFNLVMFVLSYVYFRKGTLSLSAKSDRSFPSLNVGLTRRLYLPFLCPFDPRHPSTGAWKRKEGERYLIGHSTWSLGPQASLYLALQFHSHLVCTRPSPLFYSTKISILNFKIVSPLNRQEIFLVFFVVNHVFHFFFAKWFSFLNFR